MLFRSRIYLRIVGSHSAIHQQKVILCHFQKIHNFPPISCIRFRFFQLQQFRQITELLLQILSRNDCKAAHSRAASASSLSILPHLPNVNRFPLSLSADSSSSDSSLNYCDLTIRQTALTKRSHFMPRTVSIGCQDFETLRSKGYFYWKKYATLSPRFTTTMIFCGKRKIKRKGKRILPESYS